MLLSSAVADQLFELEVRCVNRSVTQRYDKHPALAAIRFRRFPVHLPVPIALVDQARFTRRIFLDGIRWNAGRTPHLIGAEARCRCSRPGVRSYEARIAKTVGVGDSSAIC